MRGGYMTSRNKRLLDVEVRENCCDFTLITVDRKVLKGIIVQRIQIRIHSALRKEHTKNRSTGEQRALNLQSPGPLGLSYDPDKEM